MFLGSDFQRVNGLDIPQIVRTSPVPSVGRRMSEFIDYRFSFIFQSRFQKRIRQQFVCFFGVDALKNSSSTHRILENFKLHILIPFNHFIFCFICLFVCELELLLLLDALFFDIQYFCAFLYYISHGSRELGIFCFSDCVLFIVW